MTLDELVPADHLLRKIEAVIDFSFIHDRVAGVAQDIFDRIVEQVIARGLVSGKVLYTDSTHSKASANKNKFDKAMVEKSRADYWAALATVTQGSGACCACDGNACSPPRRI